MPLSHAKLWKAVDALARREGLSPSGLARRAGLDATSFNPSKRFSAGDPPRPRWPSTESLTLVLQAAGVSLADFAALADDAPATPSTVPLLGLARAWTASSTRRACRPARAGTRPNCRASVPPPSV